VNTQRATYAGEQALQIGGARKQEERIHTVRAFHQRQGPSGKTTCSGKGGGKENSRGVSVEKRNLEKKWEASEKNIRLWKGRCQAHKRPDFNQVCRKTEGNHSGGTNVGQRFHQKPGEPGRFRGKDANRTALSGRKKGAR